MVFPVLAVLICATDWQAALRALTPTVLAAAAIVELFAAMGFWWFDGFNLVHQRYWQGQGMASERSYRIWADLGRLFYLGAIQRRPGLTLLILGMLVAIVFADLSMLSKAGTERIWLPFTVWLTAAGALLSLRSHRMLLVLNIIGARIREEWRPEDVN